MNRPTINAARMHQRIEALAAIGRREDGACCRLALTDSDRAGRDLVTGWMREAGLRVETDAIGNIFGIREGREAGAPVMTGSHIDTVASGGRYDGVYGVLAGLEALQRLEEVGQVTRHALALGIFTNEEGVRFQPDMMGSLVFAGGLALEDALAAEAPDGVRLGDELQRSGYAGSAAPAPPRAFVELHIEQGPILDREGGVLGAVEDLQGISWTEIKIGGVSNHAGTTPMRLRHDAGYCAARIAVFARELTREMGGAQVATVGSIRLEPNLINVIANAAVLTVDLRNTDDEALKQAELRLGGFLDALAEAEGVTIERKSLVRTPPVRFDSGILQAIEHSAAELGEPIRRMTSGAGHDAQMIARVAPAAMIFVPSTGGISHNPREHTEPRFLEIGANALLLTLLRLAEGD